MNANIEYNDTGIIITVPCADPAAIHARLMRSIAANIEYSVASEDKHNNYADEIIPLIQLLKNILPNENQLSKAYE